MVLLFISLLPTPPPENPNSFRKNDIDPVTTAILIDLNRLQQLLSRSRITKQKIKTRIRTENAERNFDFLYQFFLSRYEIDTINI